MRALSSVDWQHPYAAATGAVCESSTYDTSSRNSAASAAHRDCGGSARLRSEAAADMIVRYSSLHSITAAHEATATVHLPWSSGRSSTEEREFMSETAAPMTPVAAATAAEAQQW